MAENKDVFFNEDVTRIWLNSLRYCDLKKFAAERKIKAVGKKSDLVETVLQKLREEKNGNLETQDEFKHPEKEEFRKNNSPIETISQKEEGGEVKRKEDVSTGSQKQHEVFDENEDPLVKLNETLQISIKTTKSSLEHLHRWDLQKLARKYKIKANMKSADIIDELLRIAAEIDGKKAIVDSQEAEVLSLGNSGNVEKSTGLKPSEVSIFTNSDTGDSMNSKTALVIESQVVNADSNIVRKAKNSNTDSEKNGIRTEMTEENSVFLGNRTYTLQVPYAEEEPSVSGSSRNLFRRKSDDERHPVHIESDVAVIQRVPSSSQRSTQRASISSNQHSTHKAPLDERRSISTERKSYSAHGTPLPNEGSSILPEDRTYIVQRTPFATIRSKENLTVTFEDEFDFRNESSSVENFVTSTPVCSGPPSSKLSTVNRTYIVNSPFFVRSCYRNQPRKEESAQVFDLLANENPATPSTPLKTRNVTRRRRINEIQESGSQINSKENNQENLTPIMSSNKKVTVTALTPRLEKLAQPKHLPSEKKSPGRVEVVSASIHPIRKWHCSRCKYVDTTKMTNAQFEEYKKSHSSHSRHGVIGSTSTPRK